ncbi:hypothetical protein [Celeribacter marinus]|uniref:Uncharacterized protein n=2 Tax=Celeribacter marinus TaxID=1397108 RepID=A0A0P0AA64_9RHOB|nr:hypothetical protein [Celeribacter marinus]ALI55630.1 hypothetical protein IMCC12053_1683 [Celeribacter marinus]
MKALRVDHVIDPFTVTGKRAKDTQTPRKPTKAKPKPKPKPKSKKKKRGLAYFIKDMAEDVFDIFD